MRFVTSLFAAAPFVATNAFSPQTSHTRHQVGSSSDKRSPPPSIARPSSPPRWTGSRGAAGPLSVSFSSPSTKVPPGVHSSEVCPSSVTSPNGSANAWEVHKFGGASLADAGLYRTVGDLLLRESAGRPVDPVESSDGDAGHSGHSGHSGPIPTMAIVSARGGMTDELVAVVDSALEDMAGAESALSRALDGQLSILKDLAPPEITGEIEARMRSDAADILSVVQSLRMIRSVPPSVMEVVTGFGEIWSAQTLYAYLKHRGVKVAWLDARDVLIVKSDSNAGLGEKGSSSSTGGVVPLWVETAKRMEEWWNKEGRREGINVLADDGSSVGDLAGQAPIVIGTGFVATSSEGVPTTLKRSGSDYSATIFAKLVGGGRVTMWKNTDGVYTADPRRVPEAFSIGSLKYDEAMELAYFGAQVLHPSAMVPCIDSNIPVYVRNIFNPSFKGTVIQGRCSSLGETMEGKVVNWRSNTGIVPIKGITSVDGVSLVTLEGASVIGGAEVAERFMGAMADASIDVLMVTQASSESSITVVVPENQGLSALNALKSTFELELSRSNVNSISVSEESMAIVAIVGEGMAMQSGVSATFMSSLAKANVNIRVIAQGSSERQVAVVVSNQDASRALRAAHMAFTLSQTMVSVAVLGGTGKIGSALIRQIDSQRQNLKDKLNFGVCVNVISSSSKMLLGNSDTKCLVCTGDPNEQLEGPEAVDFDIDALTKQLEADVNPHRIIVDCTNSDAVAEYYDKWMSLGINIISPGNLAGAGPLDRYHALQRAQRENSVEWQYESSVGSALPILSTLRDLVQTGDDVQLIRGSLSGVMAFVFNNMSEETTFSEAVRLAIAQDFAENDVRDDLSGLDARRKIVVLARELGLDVSLEDVEMESLVPDDIMEKEYTGSIQENYDAILEDLKSLDEPMMKRWKEAQSEGKQLRYKFKINVASGKCRCRLEAVDNSDSLFRLRENENLVAFETSRYTTSPLIVKGAAAGPDLSASGMFSDLLRLGRAFVGSQS